MSSSFASSCYKGILVIVAVTVLCAAYAYFLDARRAADDPKKRNYPAVGILLAPVTLPLFLLLWFALLILRILVYGLVLLLFPIALIAFRKPFLLILLHKIASFIGNRLLEANAMLIKIFLKPWLRGA